MSYDISYPFQTPCFVVDVDQLKSLISDFQRSTHIHFQSSIIGYSIKTNNTPWIIEYMKSQGLYAECVSSDEYELALECGFNPQKIIFNGPVKDREWFIYAVRNGSIVNIDSKRELFWLSELKSIPESCKIGLRVNYCIEDDCPFESQCGKEDGRFGFSYEKGELKDAISILKTLNIKLSGIHLHCSSKTRSLNIYKSISHFAVKIIKEFSLELEFVDIGGGFFGGVEGKPSFDDYFGLIKNILKEISNFNQLTIIVEPGMCLIGASIDYHTTVVDIKETKNNKFVLLDGSRIHVDPFKTKTAYVHSTLTGTNKEITDTCILAGFTCMENDRFFKTKQFLNVGDKVIFHKVGAYTMGLSSQFIQFYPKVYAVESNNVKVVRKKISAKEFIKLGR